MVFSYFRNRFLLLLGFVAGICFLAQAQKEKKRIDIIQAESLETDARIVANAQRLLGDVILKHSTITMWCDSAYLYTDRNVVDAFGNVHILKDDTLNLYAGFINYDGDRKFAKVRKNVKLVNKSTTLLTDSLDYDIAGNVGYYDYFGTIQDSVNVLTSMIGQYYTQTEKAHFKKDVVLTAEKYRLFSDTLIYDVNSKIAHIVGPTTIEDDSTTLYAEKGFYNSVSGETELLKKPVISNRKQKVLADRIFYNKTSGEGRGEGNVKMEDFDNSVIVAGNRAFFNEKEKTALVTDSALFIAYSEKDSLFLHADTLRMLPDTSAVDARLIKAYFKVKFFRQDMQGKCDSLVYWSKDSTIQLYHEPVIWTGGNQMSAHYIEMNKNTGIPDVVKMTDEAFIIAMEPDSIRYNQIKGRNMTGYIRNNELFRIDVDGNGQSLYYARDKGGVLGLNKAESSSIVINMAKNKVKRISFVSNPEGVLNPILKLEEEDTKLGGFQWLEELRPKSKEDIFGVKATPVVEEEKPVFQKEKLE